MSEDEDRLRQIFTSPDLQMVSFTITEKGYVLRDDQRHFLPAVGQDILQGPQVASTFAGRITALCLSRARAGLAPVALVSLDNCQNNSHLLRRMTTDLAGGWLEHGHSTQEDFDYIKVCIRDSSSPRGIRSPTCSRIWQQSRKPARPMTTCCA